ncbi:MAG: ADP-dependent glucokinase/phosphofructokinase [Eubacteriales bacterium]|nr:ADP-dependent glucokinase/phosphofructokinase [Eubacteriales bacterium]
MQNPVQEIEKKYEAVFAQIPEIARERAGKGTLTAMGYTSNLDILCDFSVERLNELLDKYLKGASLQNMQIVSPIRSMEDLLQTIVYYCRMGIGGEVDLEDTDLLNACFDLKYGMGGTAVQAALALHMVGVPSVVHLTDDSKEVCEILDTPEIFAVSADGQLEHTGRIQQTNDQEKHCIIQFKKGDVIRLGEERVTIPCSNRLILTQITVNRYVPFNENYFRWIEEHAEKVNSNVLSSFNCLHEEEVLSARLSYTKEHIAKYRKANPKGIVFFEDAHYHDSHIKALCQNWLYGEVDIVSLNEEELKDNLQHLYQREVDTDDILECVEGARYIRRNYGVHKGVIIHTKDYAMYVGDPLEADIEKGLMCGNMLATAKAANGLYGTYDQIREILGNSLSEKGVADCIRLKELGAEDVTLVPSKYIDKPKYTIGLGDSFVGGVQICF